MKNIYLWNIYIYIKAFYDRNKETTTATTTTHKQTNNNNNNKNTKQQQQHTHKKGAWPVGGGQGSGN